MTGTSRNVIAGLTLDGLGQTTQDVIAGTTLDVMTGTTQEVETGTTQDFISQGRLPNVLKPAEDSLDDIAEQISFTECEDVLVRKSFDRTAYVKTHATKTSDSLEIMSSDLDDDDNDPDYENDSDVVSDSDCSDEIPCQDYNIMTVLGSNNTNDSLNRTRKSTILTEKAFGFQKRRGIKEGCQRTYDKMNYCTFCGKGIRSKMSRHLLTVHGDEVRVRGIRHLPKRSKRRMADLEILANEGNFKHNVEVIKNQKGHIVIARRSLKEDMHEPKDFIPCEFCKKFILNKNLWHHRRNCLVWKEYHSKSLETGENELSNYARRGRHLLNSALFQEDTNKLEELFTRMNDDEVKCIVTGDRLIKRFLQLKMESLGDKEDQKNHDINRVSQGGRTLGRLVLEARKRRPAEMLSLDGLLKPEYFDLVVECTKSMAMHTEKDKPALTLGRLVGNLLGHSIQIKIGDSLRENNETKNQEANNFHKIFGSEWLCRVNSFFTKKINSEKRNKLQIIPLTEDLQKLRLYILDQIKEAISNLQSSPKQTNWTRLAQLTLARLILFNKRRTAEVTELKMSDYEGRPRWSEDTNREIDLTLSECDKLLMKRMDMVISAGKSRKNVNAFVLIPPECKRAIDLLISSRSAVGVRSTNPYIFSRMNSDTPLSGYMEIKDLAEACPGIKYSERISSRAIRKYAATVSQVLDMTDKEVEILATHLGHDVKTHKEFYRLANSTIELSKVSQMMLAMEAGDMYKFKGKKLKDIDVSYLTNFEEEDIDINDDVEELTTNTGPSDIALTSKTEVTKESSIILYYTK
ncbi:uncharacterized protein LOC126810662 [Patella vulgata]|uniref:uncharacterized protein LOC126810662 n=1 Tax=Patella vulgata TaxID=6465 RepID=UPI00217FC08F|nr:uncharacterized protein LOC126810662 [Patella vulgata]